MTGDADRLAVVAHELRSPVAALEALARAAPGLDAPEDCRRLVMLAVAAGRDIERLLGDPELLTLDLRRLDLSELVSGFAGESVTVRAGDPALVRADETRLRQALGNLVRNGLRHGRHVTLEVTEEGGRVVVEVADDGPGFDTDGDPFAHGTSGAGSTGIGLWLARAVAEAHDGSLELVSGASEGTRLRLALPSASGDR